MEQLLVNPRHGAPGLVVLPEGGFRRARAEIESWQGYAPTPLRELQWPGIGTLFWKDESARFGLRSFKALGGAYAVMRALSAELARRGAARAPDGKALESGELADQTAQVTVTCATDGNHGRSVAWGARRFGCCCVIFVHEHVSRGRRDAIAAFGAEVREVKGNYDDSVREAQRVAETEGWLVISDTSYPGYTEPPRDVMQGYRLMAAEALEQMGAPPTHVFVPGGVGGVAAAVSVQLRSSGARNARLVVAEPDRAACLLESARAGEAVTVAGELDTVMAGLACGEPSLLAWQELERGAFAFMAVPDDGVPVAMRRLRAEGIEAGESAVAGLLALEAALARPDWRDALGLDGASRVLVFGTEGATDPDLYERLSRTDPFTRPT
ncbi:diaminopropionate ammonia-lyase [Sabulicella glaciei]|uniref:Diaminopropionate ammonia-lyase n=1 Tax=Sabulicella glaciei TaxID=2984948 RepID=A0ABT3NW87_9PROT|nr:diaminopropionate ammonia-lyase [Roseococcus sp. MDT2-1-1]MCW8086410.1 diaminopropionate ammonia-lyase [Roseococcus sp. MDT2-1-1]